MATLCLWGLLTALSASLSIPQSEYNISPVHQARDLTVPIKLCINKGFNDCYLSNAPEGKCYNFPANLNNKVSSYIIPKKSGCTFYDKIDCDSTGFNEWTADSDKDLRDIFNRKARNDLYSSMKCYHTP